MNIYWWCSTLMQQSVSVCRRLLHGPHNPIASFHGVYAKRAYHQHLTPHVLHSVRWEPDWGKERDWWESCEAEFWAILNWIELYVCVGVCIHGSIAQTPTFLFQLHTCKVNYTHVKSIIHMYHRGLSGNHVFRLKVMWFASVLLYVNKYDKYVCIEGYIWSLGSTQINERV